MRRIKKVSVVVCNYNGEGYLAHCVECIQALGDRVDEILVIDNGSTDGSVALLRAGFPDVSVIELKKNGGPCVARNAGMKAARNRWVLAVDNDAMPCPDVLDKLVAAVEADPRAVAAQTRNVFALEPERVHYDGAHFHYLGLLSLRNFYRPVAEAEGEGVIQASGLIAITILLNRDAVLACGGYDENFFILFEDFDLALRLRIAGHILLSVEDAICFHEGGTPGISFRGGSYPKIRAFYHSRNRWLLLAKNYRWRTILACLPGMLLYEFVWTVFTLFKGHFKAHVAGKLSFFKALSDVRPKRYQVSHWNDPRHTRECFGTHPGMPGSHSGMPRAAHTGLPQDTHRNAPGQTPEFRCPLTRIPRDTHRNAPGHTPECFWSHSGMTRGYTLECYGPHTRMPRATHWNARAIQWHAPCHTGMPQATHWNAAGHTLEWLGSQTGMPWATLWKTRATNWNSPGHTRECAQATQRNAPCHTLECPTHQTAPGPHSGLPLASYRDVPGPHTGLHLGQTSDCPCATHRTVPGPHTGNPPGHT